MESATWAQEEFGSAELGDRRRNERLKAMAGRMADRPGGKLTRVYEFAAELEGAYRFVESKEVSSEEMERARGEACARRLAAEPVAIVPVDQTSIKLREQRKTDRFGSVGTRTSRARGVHLMTALALDPEGVVLGVLHQERWLRSETPTPPRRCGRRGKRKDKRPAEQRESFAWIRVLDGCEAQMRQHAPSVRAWYQADQGADFWRVFAWAHEQQAWLTARIGHERIIVNHGHQNYLHRWIDTLRVAYRYQIEIPERVARSGRTARLSVRFGTTTVHYSVTPKRKLALSMSIVAVTEPHPPRDAEPIEWLLLTTYPVESIEDADRVIRNYTLRWRCEEFHRTLKTGACDVEASELESFEAFSRLLIIASSVAARIERIKFLSRTQPDAPATKAYTPEEIEVLIRLRHQHMVRNKPAYQPSDIPPLHVVTRWVAELGGFRPSRGRGPPGTIVLCRGLVVLESAVLGARAARLRLRRCG
ncbi:IS4 family transposase [Nannocystis radixulma]|uniref:IS4 family transposase n=1 Tax=Nannocystis radixulma TaxID=2995305 RepID=A0ABT5B8M4_9BACT|nr:IS4 family transposase [Nannocystis radixulma]MDC0666866.1 IS4 family transposase [Nannocystis radixulma]MDC0667591.1 IS4 family transposase [Nannocystis radixulma]MDC0668218.1 IS4 family transposase [Nannocystis radixulma]MDC0668797.1 IS4 family transposase [Nannocystis radixulma]MDC0670452.1 IS4 family transposase [Nannocystis radixulma]